MRTYPAALALLLAATLCPAAPVPDPERQAQQVLVNIAPKLRAALEAAWKDHPYRTGEKYVTSGRELRLHRVRQTGPAEAKVSIRFANDKDGPYFVPVEVVLHYYHGRWITVAPAPSPNLDIEALQRWLAQVIDDVP
jgi:hypothetical protein